MNDIITVDGRIVKAIAGFFYVDTDDYGIVECHAKGALRKCEYRPLAGDRVSVEILDEQKRKGSLIRIYERKNSCIRPEVANADQAYVIFAYDSPAPNFLLLDRFLILLEKQGLKCSIVFNKSDLCDEGKCHETSLIYEDSGYKVYEVSARNNKGIDELRRSLDGSVTVLAGPSGVGKSSIINLLFPEAQAKTGEISRKSERGKHTTRHSELFMLDHDTYIMDTPGFTALQFSKDMEEAELKDYYHEFYIFEGGCKFDGCSHTHEPGCAIKEAVSSGKISKMRYTGYVSLYEELKEQNRYN